MRKLKIAVFLCILACTLTASAGEQNVWRLTVLSTPFEGIRIGGGITGVTHYFSFCTENETVRLIAPQIVTKGDRRYAFVKWQLPAGESYDATLTLTMTSDKLVTACYEMIEHELQVNSIPNAVEIGGSHMGTTGYTLQVKDREPVTLLTQPELKRTEGVFDFVHWLVDDVVVQEQPRLELEMETSHTLTAVYEKRMHTVSFRSEGAANVPVSGSLPGITPYDATIAAASPFNFGAPEFVVRNGMKHDFTRWMVNDHLYAEGTRTINFPVNKDLTAIAIYTPRTHLLRVKSAPCTKVEIAGSHPGSTDYEATCADNETVSLAAPEIAVCQDKRWRFDRWFINGMPEPDGQTDIQFAITDDMEARAEYLPVDHTLSIESTPVPVNIDGRLTDYQEQHPDGTDLYRNAPGMVWVGGICYVFARWSGDGIPSGNNVHVWMDGDRRIIAEYRRAPRTLTIQSVPFDGVRLEGDPDALTNCKIIAEFGDSITVRAPQTATEGERRYDFVNWSGRGDFYEREMEVPIDGEIVITANYQLRQHSLHVNSEPVNGVEIVSFITNQTPFEQPRDDMSTVLLKAPEEFVHQNVTYDFSHWRVGDAIQRRGETVLSTDMDDEYTVTAVYEERTPTLTVLSSPLPGVQIIGSHPGVSQYAAPVERGQFVNLCASPDVNIDGTVYYFAFWMIDDNLMLPGMTNLSFIMAGDTTAMAIYDWRLPGDYNEDGKIDLKDMVFVRNRLNTEPDDKDLGGVEE